MEGNENRCLSASFTTIWCSKAGFVQADVLVAVMAACRWPGLLTQDCAFVIEDAGKKEQTPEVWCGSFPADGIGPDRAGFVAAQLV